MRIVAFDLSLTRPAVCDAGTLAVLETKKLRGHERLSFIADWVFLHTRGVNDGNDNITPVDFVAIEGYAYARANQAHQIGELGGLVRHQLWAEGIPYIEVPPSSVKTYATGKGNAGKDDVLSAAHRRGGDLFTGTSNDEADAFWVWALAMDLAGEPVLTLPQTHRRALDKLQLPHAA